jgi:hypothetical protein
MRIRGSLLALVAATGLLASCARKPAAVEQGHRLPAEDRRRVEEEVRGFLARVAQEVTRDGPTAWKREFAPGQEFFMASDGKLAFEDGHAAEEGIDSVAKVIKRMELRWGKDLKIDVLTPQLAVVGAAWQERQETSQGKVMNESGYFTGVTEKQEGRWVFRDAHWSVAPVGSAP